MGTYLAVREYRHDNVVKQAKEQAALLILAAPPLLSLEGFETLLTEYQHRVGPPSAGAGSRRTSPTSGVLPSLG